MNRHNIVPFGTTPAGEAVHKIHLQNQDLSCDILTYGATLQSLVVPDRDGQRVDVLLGYDTLEQYCRVAVTLANSWAGCKPDRKGSV